MAGKAKLKKQMVFILVDGAEKLKRLPGPCLPTSTKAQQSSVEERTSAYTSRSKTQHAPAAA